MCDHCKLYLVKEQRYNPTLPYSVEYGNLNMCWFRSECGYDYNMQEGDKLSACQYIKRSICPKCGRPIEIVLNTGLYHKVCFIGIGPADIEKLPYSPVQFLSEWIESEITKYIPYDPNVKWMMKETNGHSIGTLKYSSAGYYTVDLQVEDVKMADFTPEIIQIIVTHNS